MPIINMWEHKGWKDSIYWSKWEIRELTGHLTPLPQIGDELRAQLQNDKVARFKFIEVNPCKDPRDMFFAKVQDIGYLEE